MPMQDLMEIQLVVIQTPKSRQKSWTHQMTDRQTVRLTLPSLELWLKRRDVMIETPRQKSQEKTLRLTWRRSIQDPPSKNRVSSDGMVSSPSAPNERALKQGCNLCRRNHWPVLISHKHVSAKLGHCSLCAHIKWGPPARC